MLTQFKCVYICIRTREISCQSLQAEREISEAFVFSNLVYKILIDQSERDPSEKIANCRLCQLQNSLCQLHFFCSGVACEQALSWRQGQQKFGAKRRASGACTHLPKSQLPPTRRTACQLSSFNQSARAESQDPQQTMIYVKFWFSLVFSHGKIICG